MKKTKKMIASMVIACGIITLGTQPLAHADWKNSAYEENTLEYIAKGIKHENILKFTDQGWLNINVLRADLRVEDNSLEVLTHENGVGTKGRLSELANKENVVGAVNGDFFNMRSEETLGPIVKNGELISTPFYMPEKMATFNMSQNLEPFITYWTTPQLDIVNKSRTALFTFMAINKNSGNTDTAVLFNRAWGDKSPAPPENADIAVNLIVQNGIITNILPSREGSAIPEDGYVVLATGSFANHLQQYFMVGDEVDLVVNSTPDFNHMALSLGGGAKIVNNGVVPSVFTHEIRGNHPRTALGINRDKSEVLFVTIDGRTSSYTGVSQRELGEIMVSLGAYEAINLDGGGSTEMILRPQGESNKEIVNHISSGSERRLMNGIGVVNTTPKSDDVAGIKLETSDTSVFVDTSRKLELKAYDKNYNPIDVDYSDVKWFVTGVEGSFNDNIFKPSSAGNAVVAAEYQGEYTTMEMKVLDHPVKLTLNPSNLTINTNSRKLIKVLAVDGEGYKATVNFNDLNLNIPSGLGTVDSEGYFNSASNSGSGIIRASMGDLTSSLPVAVGLRENLVEDFESNSNNPSFLSYPESVTGSYELSNKSYGGKYSGQLTYDFTVGQGTRAAYMVFDHGGISFYQRPSRLGMQINGDEARNTWIRAKVVDANGTVQNLDVAPTVDWSGWKYVEVAVPSSLKAPIKLERVYAVETDPALRTRGTVYIDDITAKYPISLPQSVSDIEEVKDSREVQAELEDSKSFRFTAHGAVTNIDTLQDNLVVQKLTKLANESGPVSVFTDAINPTIPENLNNTLINANGGHKMLKHENTLFIQLDNRRGGLRETDFSQWKWFLSAVDTTDAKNVFVLLPKTMAFNDKLEEKLFKETLQELKENKGTDVWVLQGGKNEYDVAIDEGIRYVSLKSYPQNNDIDIFTDLEYMLFTVNEDQVTYEILPMYTE